MKNNIIIFIAGLAVGVAITFVVLMVSVPEKIFVEYESKLGFAETVDAIKASAIKHEWALPHEYDLQATMKKNNFEVAPVKVISLCSPKHAYKILSGIDERKATAVMPCRVSVYEKDGKTYVSMLNAGLLSKFMDKKIKNTMGIVSDENMLILDPVIKD